MILAARDQVPKTSYVELGLGLGLSSRKEKSRFGSSGLHSGPLKTLLFACSPQGFTASRWSKINLLEHFIMVSTLLNYFHFEFLENLFSIKFW
jgi:hypothetical protein